MGSILMRLWRDDGGQDVIEYALLCAGIGIVGVAGVARYYDGHRPGVWELGHANPGHLGNA